jgi:hypothetical protein
MIQGPLTGCTTTSLNSERELISNRLFVQLLNYRTFSQNLLMSFWFVGISKNPALLGRE